MKILLTQKDFEENKIQYSSSGYIIDELCFATNWYDYEDCNSYEYSPSEPYDFNFEKDLLENTKTPEDYYKIINELYGEESNRDRYRNDEIYGTPLQTGAFIALNYPETWDEILEEYTDQLKEAKEESISESYNKEMEKALSDHEDYMYDQYLYGDQSWGGCIYDIQKKFWDGTYHRYAYDKKNHTFEIDLEADTEELKENGYKWNQGKKYLLDWIERESVKHAEKNSEERKKRREEWNRKKAYQEERRIREEEKRKQKLLSLTK